MKWLLIEGKPFAGSVQSALDDDGTVRWSKGLTVAQYEEAHNVKLRVIDDAELERLVETYTATLITDPIARTREQFNYALNVLPPCRYGERAGWTFFHVVERLTYDIVEWNARKGDKCFCFNDRASVSVDYLIAKLAKASHVCPRCEDVACETKSLECGQ